MNVDKLQALVLPWAKEHHPDKYAATLKVAREPTTFQNYMLRLLEIRWAEDGPWDAEWKKDTELSMLEETSIVQPVMFRGHKLVFAGKKVKDRVWAFAELAAILEHPDELDRLRKVKESLDLVVESVTKTEQSQ